MIPGLHFLFPGRWFELMHEQTPFGLQLVRTPGSGGSGRRAVWCHSRDVSQWIDVLEYLEKRSDPWDLRLLPIRDQGVLIFNVTRSIDVSMRGCIAYNRVADRVWIPAGAGLSAPLTQSEWDEFFPLEDHIFHPVAGVVGFDTDDILGIGDLYFPQHCAPNTEKWGVARSGVPPVSTEVSFVKEKLSSREVLEILGESLDAAELSAVIEELGQEDQSLASELLRKFQAGIVHNSSSLLLRAMPGSKGPEKNSLHRKLDRMKKASGRALEDSRNRDLQRLLQLFEEDPEKALQFSPPLGPEDGSRGVSGPGAKLQQRQAAFNLADFDRSLPAETWLIPDNYGKKLRSFYYSIASQDLRDGKFQRAAYIYGHLLGDFHSAADALRQGSMFREAAALYQEKLHNKSLAASCLAAGGEHREAALLYLALEEYEKAGDEFLHADDDQAAFDAWQLALKSTQSRMEKFRILLDRMGQIDKAVSVLAGGWPGGPEAKICQVRHLQVLLHYHRDDEIEAILWKLRNPENRISPAYLQLDNLLEFLSADNSGEWHTRVTHLALHIIGTALLGNPSDNARRQLLARLPKFRQSDPLLLHDARQFMKKSSSVMESKVQPGSLTPVRLLDLPDGIQWHNMVVAGGTHLAWGHSDNSGGIPEWVLSAAGEHSRTPSVPVPLKTGTRSPEIISANPGGAHFFIGTAAAAAAGSEVLPVTVPGGESLVVRFAHFVPSGAMAVGTSDDDSIPALIQASPGATPVLHFHSISGSLQRSVQIEGLEGMLDPDTPVQLMRRNGVTLIGFHKCLIGIDDSGNSHMTPLPSILIRLHAPVRAVNPLTAVLCRQSFGLVDHQRGGLTPVLSFKDRSLPVDCLLTTRSCPVLLERDSVSVFQGSPPWSLLYHTRLFPGRKTPVALAAGSRGSGFSVLYRDGYVQVFEIP